MAAQLTSSVHLLTASWLCKFITILISCKQDGTVVSPTKISRKIHGLLALLQRLCETRMSLEKEREKI